MRDYERLSWADGGGRHILRNGTGFERLKVVGGLESVASALEELEFLMYLGTYTCLRIVSLPMMGRYQFCWVSLQKHYRPILSCVLFESSGITLIISEVFVQLH